MNQIVMANIKLPIYVDNDGELDPMTEYIKIQIEECKELPKKNSHTNQSLMDEIYKILLPMNQELDQSSELDIESEFDNDQEVDQDIELDIDLDLDQTQDQPQDLDQTQDQTQDLDQTQDQTQDQPQDLESSIMVSIEEILENRQKKPRNNLSLKKNSKSIHNYTMKNR
jgi:hypothetical protein